MIVPVPVSLALVTVPLITVAESVKVSSGSTSPSCTLSIRTINEFCPAGMVTCVPAVAGTQTVPSKNSKLVVSKSVPAVAEPVAAAKSKLMSSKEVTSSVSSKTTGSPSDAIPSLIINVGGGVLSLIVVVTLLAVASETSSPVELPGLDRLMVKSSSPSKTPSGVVGNEISSESAPVPSLVNVSVVPFQVRAPGPAYELTALVTAAANDE